MSCGLPHDTLLMVLTAVVSFGIIIVGFFVAIGLFKLMEWLDRKW